MAKAKKKDKSRGSKKGATKKRRRTAHRGGINFGPYYASLAKEGKKGRKKAKAKSRGGGKKGGTKKGRKHRTAAQKRATAALVARNKHRRGIAAARAYGKNLTPEQKMMLRIGRKKAKAARHAAPARPSTGYAGGGFSPEYRAKLEAMKAARAKAAAAATPPSSHYDVW